MLQQNADDSANNNKIQNIYELKTKSMKIMTVVNARVLAIWAFWQFFSVGISEGFFK